MPWAVVSGVNVATILTPPPALAPFGAYYRLVQGLACLVLQTISVGVHLGLSKIVESLTKRRKKH